MHEWTIMFDFDGTLFMGTTDINEYAINRSLEDMGLPPVSREVANSTVGDRLIDACERLLGGEQGAQTLYEGIMRHAPEAIERYSGSEPGSEKMLRELFPKANLAICSNAERSYLENLLGKLGVAGYFSLVWHRREGVDKKAAIPVILRQLGGKGIMVGDRAEDVQAGKANGCVTVAMDNDFGARDAVGADVTVTTHEQMLSALLDIIKNP